MLSSFLHWFVLWFNILTQSYSHCSTNPPSSTSRDSVIMIGGISNQDMKTRERYRGCCNQVTHSQPSHLLSSLLTARALLHFSAAPSFLPTHCMPLSFSYKLRWRLYLLPLQISHGEDHVDMGFPCTFNRFLSGIHQAAHHTDLKLQQNTQQCAYPKSTVIYSLWQFKKNEEGYKVTF